MLGECLCRTDRHSGLRAGELSGSRGDESFGITQDPAGNAGPLPPESRFSAGGDPGYQEVFEAGVFQDGPEAGSGSPSFESSPLLQGGNPAPAD